MASTLTILDTVFWINYFTKNDYFKICVIAALTP